MFLARSVFSAALALICATSTLAAQATPDAATPVPVPTYPDSPRSTGITVSATQAPLRVPGSDGMDHWDYDLIVTNALPAPLTLTSVEVFDATGDQLLKLDGDALVTATQPLLGTAPTAAIPGSGAVAVVIDVVVPPGTEITALGHKVTYSYPADGPGAAIIGTTTYDGPLLEVDARAPISIAPPLQGDSWIAFNGCCADPGSIHRAIRAPFDGGGIAKAELFAIDWLQLEDGEFFSEDGSQNEQWYGFGDDILAVADGTVVYVRDDMPEQIPNQQPTAPVIPEDYAGNQIILEIAPGVYALYAHLQGGSLQVAVGDRVTAGQAIAKLGNSGNTEGAHLHFSLLDKPNAVTGDSLPFVLTSYGLEGTVDPSILASASSADGPPKLIPSGPSGPQVETFPLWMSVIDLSPES